MPLITVCDEAQMCRLAYLVAHCGERFHTVYLMGELGAGKTTWVRGLLRALGVTGPVKSPTFTLVESYETAWGMLHHFDLYRLEDPEELEFLGIRDFLAEAGCLLFEWPERGEGFLPPPDLTVKISYAPSGRIVTMETPGPSQAEALRRITSSDNSKPRE